MINYKKAKKILQLSKIKISDELIDSSKSLNRINVLDIYSPVNYPAGTNAAFDGFAINSKETINLNKNNFQNILLVPDYMINKNPHMNFCHLLINAKRIRFTSVSGFLNLGVL